ncbi:L-glutamate gamma-semialdehyde dehydrogenase [Thalassoglobus polymorphus]|uniref:L-glutamate gamma-semialdehyde dehydrogenase n=1 Tax=Thalassoglobus polymorphus TaxID=2527994 RepID=A0A517QMH1_9PLAN|nr:L-glutamate gamma-semialdehyde dehydrogenase [Thalassoglobus polymorphus]QDT32801.1 1-pyrroline-5-carboxylate dehydrogenase 1 [Thalassoglobus polymorphus]
MSTEDRPNLFHVQRFENEPNTDFSRAENREDMKQALKDVEALFGADYPLNIDGKAQDSRSHIISRSPSSKETVLGTVASANRDQAEQAIETARRAWPQWQKIPADHRAEYLELIASGMQTRRFELAAWMIHESGKSWKEADAEVSEAIDFCRYYSLAMRDLVSELACDYPGEENRLFYRSRGVAVVIAPWNFPLAILTGMTVAALVTGNTVVMKPAEQSSIVAAKLMEIARDSGLPTGVLNFLPGNGEELGPVLVGSPDVDLVVFTGSQEVGLSINKLAAETVPAQLNVKKVIAEMGGKNAIIVDDDADLDDAVQGVVNSAFGYAGQKCSACSRVIVLKSIFDEFTERLVNAVESLVIGPADDPGIDFGPVIDQEAYDRINDYIELGAEECETIVSIDLSDRDDGYFIGPQIFNILEEDSRLAQAEIFGPVLSVMKARDMDHALKLANNTAYALTGGVYSRSPKNLKRAREEFLVGNLYLNREITGAIVQRHPFGGFRMSGIGSKAGGPDYLQQFMLPVNITENTMRRGFAPKSSDEE